MKIRNTEFKYVGSYHDYKEYGIQSGGEIIGYALYLGKNGEYRICDPDEYVKVSEYLIEHYPEGYKDDEE